MWHQKARAAGIHIAISSCVGIAIYALFVLVWYPPPLFTAMGTGGLLTTILAVDVVLGPLLTFAVYRRGKRHLKFDLGAIALAQALALAYGLHVAFFARPVFVAILPMRATVVRANELVLDSAASFEMPLWGPRLVAVVDSSTPEDREALLFQVLAGAPDMDYRPHFYRVLDAHLPALIHGAPYVKDAVAEDPRLRAHMQHWARSRGHASLANLRYLPLVTRGDELMLILDARNPSVVGIATPPSDHRMPPH